MIFEKSLNMSVVKLFMKNIRRQDFRISLKNCTVMNSVVELGIIKNDKNTKVRNAYFDFKFYSNFNLKAYFSRN